MEKKKNHLPELDGLRGLLAFWVAFSHILCWTGFADIAWRFPGPLKEPWFVFVYAQAAVDAFIILSGFAISFLAAKHQGAYSDFMLNRVFRIYPVYLLCLGLGLITVSLTPSILGGSEWAATTYFKNLRAISAAEQDGLLPHALAHLTLLNGLLPRDALPNATATLLPPAWSISLEWQFYLVAPLVVAACRKPSGLFLLLAASIVGGLLAPAWTNLHLAFLPAQLPLFLIGIGSYHLYLRVRVKGVSHAALGVGVVVAAGASVITGWHATAVTIWAGCLATTIACGEPAGAWLRLLKAALLTPALQWLGRVSYPLYLVHWPVIVFLLHGLQLAAPRSTGAVALAFLVVVGLPVMLVLSYCLHVAIERPAMSFGKGFLARRRQGQTPAQGVPQEM